MKKIVLLLSIAIVMQSQGMEHGTDAFCDDSQTSLSNTQAGTPTQNTLPAKIEIKGELTFAQKAKRTRLVKRELDKLHEIEDDIKKRWADDGGISVTEEDKKALGFIQQRIIILENGQEKAFKNYLWILKRKHWDTVALKTREGLSFQGFLVRYREEKRGINANRGDNHINNFFGNHNWYNKK